MVQNSRTFFTLKFTLTLGTAEQSSRVELQMIMQIFFPFKTFLAQVTVEGFDFVGMASFNVCS